MNRILAKGYIGVEEVYWRSEPQAPLRMAPGTMLSQGRGCKENIFVLRQQMNAQRVVIALAFSSSLDQDCSRIQSYIAWVGRAVNIWLDMTNQPPHMELNRTLQMTSHLRMRPSDVFTRCACGVCRASGCVKVAVSSKGWLICRHRCSKAQT
jgi:hypothetical protein